ARARINGTSDIYVKTGSLLTLTCLMSQGPHHLGTVAWYRGNHAVVTSPRLENDVNAEPRITVETEWSDALTSRNIPMFGSDTVYLISTSISCCLVVDVSLLKNDRRVARVDYRSGLSIQVRVPVCAHTFLLHALGHLTEVTASIGSRGF
ncbi:lachesin-like isoform X1, partial [Vespula squamosa]